MNKQLTFLTFLALSCGSLSFAQIIFSEDFEDFGEGDTTVPASASFDITNGFNDRTDFFAMEGAGSDPAGAGNNGGDLFGADNTLGFGWRDLSGGGNPGGPNYITFDPISTTVLNGLTFTLEVASRVGDISPTDELRVTFDLDYDGSTFDSDETYVLNGNGSGALSDGISTAIESSFTNFSYDIAGTLAGDLGIRIEAIGMTGGGDRVTFDNVQVVPEPSAFALLGGLLALGFAAVRRRNRR